MPTGNLPAEGKKLWEEVYNKALKGSCKDNSDPKGCAAGSAWKAVANAGWKKGADGIWHKSANLTEFSLRIERASYDKATNTRRWRAVASDTDEDDYQDNMTLELFNDFLHRIETKERPPKNFTSDFWQGGMPYTSISHYPDFNGNGVPGEVEATYIDGTYLKAKGTFADTPLGRKCFEAVCADLYNPERSNAEDKVRVSIAFLDWAHKHKLNGFYFERKSLDDICPECIMEMITGEGAGKSYIKGHLIHYALTRVPVNRRTSMEVDKSMAEITTRKDDAASIVGDEIAEELEEQAKLVGKSQALVIKSEHMMGEDECAEDDEECKEKMKKAKEEKSTALPPDSNSVASSVVISSPTIQEVPEEIVRNIVKSVIKETKVDEPTKQPHVLDTMFSEMKAKYDEIVASPLGVDEKLQAVQEPFNKLGEQLISNIRGSVPTPTASGNDLVDALTKVMQPIGQKLDLLLAQQSQPMKSSGVPNRRSIAPSEVPILEQASVVKSETPNLRKLIEKTT